MTPDVETSEEGVVRWRLDGSDDVEQLAAALEEAAARVRACPPYVHAWTVEDGVDTAPGDPYRYGCDELVLGRRPVERSFVLRWPT